MDFKINSSEKKNNLYIGYYLYMYVCVCMCKHTHTHVYLCIHTHIYKFKLKMICEQNEGLLYSLSVGTLASNLTLIFFYTL